MKEDTKTAQTEKSSHPEIKGLLTLAIAFFLLLSLFTFERENVSGNWLGLIGNSVALSMLYCFGLCSYLITGWIGYAGWKWLTTLKTPFFLSIRSFYFSLFLFSLCILLNLFAELTSPSSPLLAKKIFSEVYFLHPDAPSHHAIRYNLGGVPTYYLYKDLPTLNLENLLSNMGVCITFSLMGIMSFILFTNTSLISAIQKLGKFFLSIQAFLINIIKDLKAHRPKPDTPIQKPSNHLVDLLERAEKQPPTSAPTPATYIEEEELTEDISLDIHTHLDKKSQPLLKKIVNEKRYKGAFKRYRLPPASLLTNAKKIDAPTLKKDLKKQSQILEETLLSFGVKARVGKINCGPTITSFEVHPPVGVKVQKIKVLENDIALNLESRSIRIIAPIPGKAAVGVEIPSLYPQEVGFKEMLTTYQKREERLHIPIMLGQTVSGENVFSDLTKMPHCIIAGATGSGKSVCINSIVMSILMTARPDEVKLLLVDPKKVELSAYTRLPHMLAPVITEAHGAYAALNWLVKEMHHRYEILKRIGLRNINAFNHRKIKVQKEKTLELEIPEKMPYIVAIIDEFADLMMASSSDLETPIARIAQMARAVGIHLILATQRPSREVITGLIKANFPGRIAFKVASRVNSQIILDENGAETLLGNGDLLFIPPGTSFLTRAQGVYIRDEDINRVIDHIEMQAHTNYLIKSFDKMAEEDLLLEKESPKDNLYNQAFDIVSGTGTASTTFLQRKLKIGYARAASLMDELETRKVIGPQEGSRPRQILISPSEKKDD